MLVAILDQRGATASGGCREVGERAITAACRVEHRVEPEIEGGLHAILARWARVSASSV